MGVRHLGQEQWCRQETDWQQFQHWSIIVSPAVPCFCVVSDVLIVCVFVARCGRGCQSSQPMFISWYTFPVVSEPHHTQALFVLPCCLKLTMSRRSALNQGKVIMLP